MHKQLCWLKDIGNQFKAIAKLAEPEEEKGVEPKCNGCFPLPECPTPSCNCVIRD
jgi:hypothetical protein